MELFTKMSWLTLHLGMPLADPVFVQSEHRFSPPSWRCLGRARLLLSAVPKAALHRTTAMSSNSQTTYMEPWDFPWNWICVKVAHHIWFCGVDSFGKTFQGHPFHRKEGLLVFTGVVLFRVNVSREAKICYFNNLILIQPGSSLEQSSMG